MIAVRRFHIQENGVLYPSDNGMVCYYMDVAKIEASHAELLEALKKALDALGGNDPHDLGYEDSICGYIRAAINKATGDQL